MMTRTNSRALMLLSLFGFGVGASLGGCTLANPDHCQNIAIDPNAWCASVHPDQPYCSPCEADDNGCVADEPSRDECPAYTAPAPDTSTGSDSDSGDESETSDTGTEDTSAETETSTG
jgi:hypothetical protein